MDSQELMRHSILVSASVFTGLWLNFCEPQRKSGGGRPMKKPMKKNGDQGRKKPMKKSF